MKEAIEAVIKDLERKSEQAGVMHRDYMDKGETSSEMFNFGLYVAYEKAIKQLEGVLAQHGTNDSSRIQGNVGEETEQVPFEKNRS